MPADRAALQRLYSLPRLTLLAAPTPVEEMNRLSDALVGDSAGSAAPRLLVKRDDDGITVHGFSTIDHRPASLVHWSHCS